MRRRGWPVMILLAVVLGLTTAVAAGARGQEIDLDLTYGVYAKGFKGLNVEVAVAVEGDGYLAHLDARTTGLVSWFVDWELEAQSIGAIGSGLPVPLAFKTSNKRRDTERWVEIAYQDHGPPAVSAEPSVAVDDRPVIDPEMTVGTVDPISALVGFLVSMNMSGDQVCPNPTSVFDGRRLYDVSGEVLDPRNFPGGGIAPFAGEAAGCQLELEKLGGFKETESSNRDVLNSQIVMWLADVGPDGMRIPVRLEMKGRVGRTLVHLLQVRDRDGTVLFGAT